MRKLPIEFFTEGRNLHARKYRPNEVFTTVCHSIHRAGCLPHCMLGCTHPRQTPPKYYGIQSTRSQYTSYWNAYLFILHLLMAIPVAEPGFPWSGSTNLPGGANIWFCQNFQKLHEIERIWTTGGATHPKFYYVDPILNTLVLIQLR